MTGGEIKALRERLGWSQYHLADYLGLTQASVSRLESGHQELSGPVLKLLVMLRDERSVAA
jgi:DNA-binding transcriptional regulator YiaG